MNSNKNKSIYKDYLNKFRDNLIKLIQNVLKIFNTNKLF